MVIALGLASDAILFDNARTSYYPSFEQWQALSSSLQSGGVLSPPK